MRVVYRLTALLLLAACLVLSIYGVLTVRREALMFEATMIEDARLNGFTLRAALEEIARTHGSEAAGRLVDQASGGKLSFRCLLPQGETFAGIDLSASERESLRAGQDFVQIDRGSPGQIRLYLPLHLGEAPVALLEVRESLQREQDYVDQSLQRVAVATVLLVLLSGGLAFLIGVQIVGRPMERLIRKLRRVGQGVLDDPIEITQRDEIGQLADAVNDMCTQLAAERRQREEAEVQLRHAERLATVGKLASGLAHELGTPLNVILGRALQVAEDPGCPPESAEAAQIVVGQAERMSGIIRQLLDYARLDARREERVDLAQLLDEVSALLRPMARRAQVEVTLDSEAGATLIADPDPLRQALTNLVLNGIQAMPEGGELVLAVARTEAAKGEGAEPVRCLAISIKDQGAGIPAEQRARVFEPFFTTKGAGEGTGLGLAIAQRIVLDHGGWLELESELGVGTEVRVYLPERS